VLSRKFLQLDELEAGTIIFSFGRIQQAEIAKCYQQVQYIAQLKTESIRKAKQSLEELQAQDQIEGKYVGRFEEIIDIFDRKDSEFEFCKDIAREALLALAVRQLHQAKEAKAKVECLLDQPRGLIFDAVKYRNGLSKAQDDHLATFAIKWIKLDPLLKENQNLHYVYDTGAWCLICEELLCKFR
jgi:hypothetical protein